MRFLEKKEFFKSSIDSLEKLVSIKLFDKLNGEIPSIFVKEDFLLFRADNESHLACAYLKVISEKEFIRDLAPFLHFLACQDVRNLIGDENLRFCIPKENLFDFKVATNGLNTRLFYSVPLKLCPRCNELLCSILSNASITTLNQDKLMNILLRGKLKRILRDALS